MSSVYTYPGGSGAVFTGGSISSPLLAPNGTAAAPSYSFSSASNYGWYYDSVNSSLAGSINGVETAQIFTSVQGPSLLIGPKSAAGVTLTATGSNTLTLYYGNGTSNPGNLYVYNLAATNTNAGAYYLGNNGQVANAGVIASLYANGSSARLAMGATDSQTWDYTTQDSTFASNVVVNKTIKYKAATASKSTAYTVVAADSATTFDNTGAAAGVTFTLPAAAVGLTYTFGTAVAQIVTVAPQAVDAIGAKAVNTSYASAAAKGSYFTVTCTAANYWLITSNNGFA